MGVVSLQWGGAETRVCSCLHSTPTTQAYGLHRLSCKVITGLSCRVTWQEINRPLIHKPWPQNFNEGIMNEDQNYPKGSEKWFQPFWEHFLFICEDLDEIKAFDTREQQKWWRGPRPGLRGNISGNKALLITLGEASTRPDYSCVREPDVQALGWQVGPWKMENCEIWQGQRYKKWVFRTEYIH